MERKEPAQAEKQHSPQREGFWAEDLAQRYLKHWELVGTIAVGLWEKHLGYVCEKNCKTIATKSTVGREAQFRALEQESPIFPTDELISLRWLDPVGASKLHWWWKMFGATSPYLMNLADLQGWMY